MGKVKMPKKVASNGDKPTIWRTFVLEGGKLAAATIVGGIVALTLPVRAIVYDQFWTVPPKLTLVPPVGPVHADERIDVRLIVEPVFPGVVPTGTVTFEIPKGLAQQSVRPLSVSGGDQVMVLPDAGTRLEFRALEPGVHKLTAMFESAGRARASARSSVEINVAPRSGRKFASVDYLGGTWSLKRGGSIYTMLLTEPKKRTVTGTLEVGGSTWQVYGTHDGGDLWMYLIDPTSTNVRLFLDGKTVQEGEYIKASGAVITQRIENGQWVDQKEPKESFEANTPTGP